MQVCWKLAVGKPVWHTPFLYVQWKTPDDGQRNCPKHVEFHSKNKFEISVHLVGFIIRMYITCIRILDWHFSTVRVTAKHVFRWHSWLLLWAGTFQELFGSPVYLEQWPHCSCHFYYTQMKYTYNLTEYTFATYYGGYICVKYKCR